MAKTLGQLSRREFEAVRLVALAKSNKQIARQLQVSESAVEKFLWQATAKMGLQDFNGNLRVQLARTYWAEVQRDKWEGEDE